MTAALAVVLVASGPAGVGGPAPVTLSLQTDPAGLTATHSPDEAAIPGFREHWIGGMAVGDFDNDGYPDLFWLSGGTLPDKLFINNRDGTFTDHAAQWGLATLHCGSGVSAGDYNGDGHVDLYVTSFGPPDEIEPGRNRLYRNNGDGSFSEVAVAAGVNYTSPTTADGFGSVFGDYDLDGDLDLFVTTHTTAFGDPVESDGNRLYRNNGDETFTDVTAESGIGATIDGVRGFQPVFVDMDGDLYPELLLSADVATSRYYINNGDGTFTDATSSSGCGLDANGMGQTIGDFDLDGYFDWYVTSIHLEREWTPPVPGTGNMLYLGQPDHLFVENSIAAGVNDGGWGWGALAVDLDHDGLEEILEVNGWMQGTNWIGERGKLFYNNGNGNFTEIALAAGFDSTGDGRAMVYLDVELDGDLDIIVGNFLGPLEYYRNDTGTGNWLRVTLDTGANPLLAPDGFGTEVIVNAGGQTSRRFMSSSPSFLATSELVVHFGLGSVQTIDELRIEWSRGQVTVMTGVPANQHLTVAGPRLGDLDGDDIIGITDFLGLLGSWGPVGTTTAMIADLDADGTVGITDLLIMLANWG